MNAPRQVAGGVLADEGLPEQVITTIADESIDDPLVGQLAFAFYVTGDYSLEDLSDEFYDRGLRTRPTGRHPAKQVSINKLSMMLRERLIVQYTVSSRSSEYT